MPGPGGRPSLLWDPVPQIRVLDCSRHPAGQRPGSWCRWHSLPVSVRHLGCSDAQGTHTPLPSHICHFFFLLSSSCGCWGTGPSWSWHRLICSEGCLRRIGCPLPCSGNSLLEMRTLLKSKVTVGYPRPRWPDVRTTGKQSLLPRTDDPTAFQKHLYFRRNCYPVRLPTWMVRCRHPVAGTETVQGEVSI